MHHLWYLFFWKRYFEATLTICSWRKEGFQMQYLWHSFCKKYQLGVLFLVLLITIMRCCVRKIQILDACLTFADLSTILGGLRCGWCYFYFSSYFEWNCYFMGLKQTFMNRSKLDMKLNLNNKIFDCFTNLYNLINLYIFFLCKVTLFFLLIAGTIDKPLNRH